MEYVESVESVEYMKHIESFDCSWVWSVCLSLCDTVYVIDCCLFDGLIHWSVGRLVDWFGLDWIDWVDWIELELI